MSSLCPGGFSSTTGRIHRRLVAAVTCVTDGIYRVKVARDRLIDLLWDRRAVAGLVALIGAAGPCLRLRMVARISQATRVF